MPKKGKVIEVYKKNFEGIGTQDIRIYLDKKSGLFSCDVPKKVIKPSNSLLPESKPTILIETEYLCNKEYKQIISSIHSAKSDFENFDKKYERVILIKFENYTSSMDGSGRGLQLNWGVFRKYEKESGYFQGGYILESSHVGENGKHQSYQYYKDWKEVPYSDDVKNFLLHLDKTIDGVREKLDNIINSTNFEEKVSEALKLLN
jgi:hypothetical protein